MGFKIPCPHCGERDVYEFSFGSEVKDQPPPGAGIRAWRHYLYFNQNLCGVQSEWWCHSAGCGTWFRVKRDTLTNNILED
jgi:sarcosine oxidase subunit delta